VATDDYSTWLEGELGGLVGELDLNPRQKTFWRARWLDQVVWLEGKAKQCQQRHYALRLIAIVGGLTVPALVSLNVRQGSVASALAWTTFAVSLLVAIAVSVEGFFRYGERWRHYRRTAELLKGHGWQFYELAGAYAAYASHRAAFRSFATAVETLIAEEVDVYIKQVTREQQRQEPEGEAGAESELKPEA
jgi:hypothetical protein